MLTHHHFGIYMNLRSVKDQIEFNRRHKRVRGEILTHYKMSNLSFCSG